MPSQELSNISSSRHRKRGLTGVDSIEPRLHQVIQLEDEGPRSGEKRHILGHILHICPNDTISASGFRCRSAPDFGYNHVKLGLPPGDIHKLTFHILECKDT